MITFLLILSILLNGVGVYVIVNLLRKVEMFEEFFEKLSEELREVLDTMQSIDSSGAFEAEDEVGATFKALKLTIDTLEQFVVRESDGQKEESIRSRRRNFAR